MGANIRAIKLNKLFKLYATFSVAFLLSYAISGVVSPISNSSAVTCVNGMISGTSDVCSTDTTDINVSIEGAWTVAVSSSGTLNVDVTPKGSGTTSTATDNVNIYTNTPNGYQLYLNSTSGSTDIYNNTDTEHERNHFIATTGTKSSPVALSSNSWGYSLASSPTTFSKVEESSSAVDSLITTGSKTSGSGDNLPVTYGFNADTKLTPGTYTTSVTYTAVAEVPSYTLSSISPSRPAYNASNIPVTIVTTTPVSELGLGDITAKIGTVDLTNCTETIVTVDITSYRAATCTYPGGLSAGRYNVELTSSWHNATYTLNSAFSVNSMQEFTSTNCTNLPESTTTIDNRIDLVDSRDGKTYKVSKLADGNCWMTDNLALDGSRTLTTADSNVTQSRTLPANIPNGTASEYDTAQIYSGNANSTTTTCDSSYPDCIVSDVKYGNLYNWNAATATVGKQATTTDVTESVCPKGWQLPNNTGTKSFNALMTAYNLPTTGNILNHNAVQTVQALPLLFPLSAGYDSSSVNQGSAGSYISRTVYANNTDKVYRLHFNAKAGNFAPQNDIHKLYGFAVRCIFGS